MTAPPFHGKASGGKFIAENASGLKRFLDGLEGQRLTVTVQKFRKARTEKQNGFLWASGGPYATLAPELTKMSHELVKQGIMKEPQFFDVDAVHDLMKTKFLKRGTDDLYVIGSTTELTTVEFNEYIENIAHWAAGLGVYIAMPNETELLSHMEKTHS